MTEDNIRIISSPAEVQAIAKEWKKQGYSIGLVPTMGYLHDGHRSLIHRACAENDRVIVSVFVNPIQFGPTEDPETYPRDLEADTALCASEGVNIRSTLFYSRSCRKNHFYSLRKIGTDTFSGCYNCSK